MKIRKPFGMLIVSFLCLAVIGLAKIEASAAQPFLKADERGVSLQYVPLTGNNNGWSDTQKIYGGEQKEVKWHLYKPDDLAGDATFINHFIGIQKVNAKADDPVTVMVEDARIVRNDGTVIPFQTMDGKYKVTECEDGKQLCTDHTVTYQAADIDNGYFCATISVQYDTQQNIDGLDSLAKITGELPGEEFYQVDENQITLTDFDLDGTMCITGNENQENVVLVIKGDCTIRHLTIQCPVIVKRYAYGRLTCEEYECKDTGNVTFDQECNATRLVKDGQAVSIEFDDTRENMTQGELDEKNDTYNFAWRHRNSAWYQQALAMIERNRKQTPQLHFVDENGNAVKADRVDLKLSDYDYLFGRGNNGVMLNDDGKLTYWENQEYPLQGNVIIEYDAFGWESYDPSHQGEYNFETSSSGNTTYLKDGTTLMEENGVTRVAQPIIYPAFGSMRYNSASTTMYDSVVAYVLSDSYTPEGFNQMIKDHIREEVTEYAGVVKVWAVVNEAFYSTDFFKLIYGSDGTGISKETIASVLEEKGVANGTNNEKLAALVSYLKEMELTPAEETAKLIAEWAETAQAAWDSTITPDCGYTSDLLTLYYNDAVFKGYTLDAEGHYDYNMKILEALGKAETYPGKKVLIRLFGSQFSSWFGYCTTPQEVWEMLDETEAVGEKTWVTEFCYWLNHPYSENGDDIGNYGEDNPGYMTAGFLSKAEEEFAYDYAYYILTAFYAHKSTEGFHATCYPHGQLGFSYRNQKISPLGEAYNDLVMNEWNTSFTADLNGRTSVTTEPLSNGTYAANITVGDKTYRKNIKISSGATDISVTLEDAAGMVTFALGTDSYSVSLQKGAFLSLPECPVQNLGNKSFIGWSETEDGTGTVYQAGSKYIKSAAGEVILYPVYEETECMTAVLYSDGQYTQLSEELGTFRNITDLNQAIEDKSGYLQIMLERDVVLDALPGAATLSAVRICNKEGQNYALLLEAADISLRSDTVLALNTKLLSKKMSLKGNNYKLILEGMTFSGGDLTAEGVELICGYQVTLAGNIDGLKSLYLDQNKSITEENGNLYWENVYGGSSLLIKGKISNIGTLYMYGNSIYLEKTGSMELNNIAGIYGDIYQQKRADRYSGLTVKHTMEDMIWQIRLKIYETLDPDVWSNTVSCPSVLRGTPLANLPESADPSCQSKLGFIVEDDWSTYDKKLCQDGILYYADGGKIEHLWENNYTEDVAPTCTREGKKSIHCSACDAAKDQKIIAKTAHVKDRGSRVEPACEKTGSITYRCTTCGVVIETKKIAATGHSWDQGKITKKATEKAEGVKTYACKNCGKKKTEAIPKKKVTKPKSPKKGEVRTDDKKSGKYKVTDTKKKEVSFKEPVSKKVKTVTIPATIKINKVTYKVTKIEDSAFKKNKTITKITVGSNVKTIGKYAFGGATKLKTVVLGKNVVSVEANAFNGCTSLTGITLPVKTTKIGANAFTGCKKLKTITIKSDKMTTKTVAKNAYKGVLKTTTIRVPKKKLTSYKKLLKAKGLSSKIKVKGY